MRGLSLSLLLDVEDQYRQVAGQVGNPQYQPRLAKILSHHTNLHFEYWNAFCGFMRKEKATVWVSKKAFGLILPFSYKQIEENLIRSEVSKQGNEDAFFNIVLHQFKLIRSTYFNTIHFKDNYYRYLLCIFYNYDLWISYSGTVVTVQSIIMIYFAMFFSFIFVNDLYHSNFEMKASKSTLYSQEFRKYKIWSYILRLRYYVLYCLMVQSIISLINSNDSNHTKYGQDYHFKIFRHQ